MNKVIPGATDDLQTKRFYHGTRAELKPGDLIEPSNSPDAGEGDRMTTYVYLTRNLDEAIWEAEIAAGEGPGKVYLVESIGHLKMLQSCRAGSLRAIRRCHVVPVIRCGSLAKSRSGLFTMELGLT